jgi:hypothetical protein
MRGDRAYPLRRVSVRKHDGIPRHAAVCRRDRSSRRRFLASACTHYRGYASQHSLCRLADQRFQLLGVSSYWVNGVQGVLILLVVAATSVLRPRGNRQ